MNFIPMEEVENKSSSSQVLQNVRTLIEKSVLKKSIELKELTGVDADDIKNLHAALSDIVKALGE